MSLEPNVHMYDSQFQTAPATSSAQTPVGENFDNVTQPNRLNMLSYDACAGNPEGRAPSDGAWTLNQTSKPLPPPQQRLGHEGTELYRSQHLSATLNHIYY